MASETTTRSDNPHREEPPVVTLLDLVTALVESGANETEVVVAVVDLVKTRRVHLVGVIEDDDVVEEVA